MEVKKVLSLSTQEEHNKLIDAGRLLGEIRDGFEAGKIDLLDDSAAALIKAIKDVSDTVYDKHIKAQVNDLLVTADKKVAQ